MLPSPLQLPPQDLGAAASAVGAPPVTDARHSLPLAKNAIDPPSGEKNGHCAPRLASTGRAANESIARRYSRDVSRDRPAAYAIVLPSAEIAGAVVTCSPGGSAIDRCAVVVGSAGLSTHDAVAATKATTGSATHHNRDGACALVSAFAATAG